MDSTSAHSLDPREKRRFTRYNISGTVPCDVFDRAGNRLEAVFMDVSVKGAGMILEPGPRPGDYLEVRFDGPQTVCLRFKVQWVASNAAIQKIADLTNMERVGLALMEPVPNHADFNFVDFLQQFGSLEISE